MEESLPDVDPNQKDKTITEVSFSKESLENHLKQIRDEERRRAEQRRRGRPLGLLTDSLLEKLRSCNILQLQKVKKTCDALIERQRKPPEQSDCKASYVLLVLLSVPVRNRRFQLEFRRNSVRNARLYANGPYVWAYWWDGQYIRKKYFAKKDFKHLPRKFRAAMSEALKTVAVPDLRKKLNQKLSLVKQ